MKTNIKSHSIKRIRAGSRSSIWRGWRFKAFLLGLLLVLLSLPPPSARPHTLASSGRVEIRDQPSYPVVASMMMSAPVAVPIASPQSFRVRGEGGLTISGPRCCGGDPIHARLEMDYTLHPDSRVTITRLRIDVNNFYMKVDRVGRRRDQRFNFYCNTAINVGPILGTVDSVGKLTVPVGAAEIFATTFADCDGPLFFPCPRTPCGRTARGFTQVNATPIRGRLDPTGDQFTLETAFTIHDEDDWNVSVHFSGNYLNRPPVAVIGVEGPRLPFLAQGGCPPLSGINPPTTEANDPEGLRLTTLRSLSFDPDGVWPRADIFLEQWFRARAGDPIPQFLGRGREVGPVLFEFGIEHAVTLRVTDRSGATSVDGCRFIVVDTTPPLVISPPVTVIPCSEPGGASARTSPALRRFLQSATASDNSDPAPVPLPPRLAGREITDSTLFPLSRFTPLFPPRPHPVEFRFIDRHGNVGSARSGVWVVDRQPPSLRLELDPSVLDPTFEFVTIRADIFVADVCSGVRVILESIESNAPAQDPDDIRGAMFGTDDRMFQLRAVPVFTPDQQVRDRIYTVTYVATDEFGNETRAAAEVIVKAT